MSDTANTKCKSQLKSFLSGGVGGICLVLVGHPFDLIKVKMQTGSTNASIISSIQEVITKSGFRGLYKGVTAPLLAITPIFAICFWGYEVGGELFDFLFLGDKHGDYQSSDIRAMVAGGFSALPATLVMAPAERIKVIMQTSEAGFSGAMCRAWGEGGVRSMFKGSLATLARDIPGSVAYFGVYEVAKRRLLSKMDNKSLAVLTAGGLAGMANWAVAIPADVVKSRWQSASPGEYKSSIDVLKQLLKKEGPGALFKGIGPVMMRAFPANAACFFGMETSKQAFSKIL